MSIKRFAFSALTVLGFIAGSASGGHAGEKVARCRVVSSGSLVINGRCLFDGAADGSFHLGNVDPSKPLFDAVLLINVAVYAPGAAQVRGLTTAGINSMWGDAHRSSRDRACWDGDDFRICAY